jgi:hypothetical protein
MNRKKFLKITGAITAGVVVGATGIKVVTMLSQDQLEALKTGFTERLIQRYGETRGKLFAQKIEKKLETTLSQLPNIGTAQENRWAVNMPSTAFALAAYRVLVPEHVTLEEFGQMIYETSQKQMSGIPTFVMRVTYNEQGMMEKTKLLATRSQQCQYSEDWVMTFVEGNGQDFTYGVDVTECAILKYLEKQGASELTRYLCLTDYLTSEAMGRGLVRYKTLAEGCKGCDFRYQKGRPSYLHPLRDGWPPKFGDCGS